MANKITVATVFFTIIAVVSAIVLDPKCASVRDKGYEIASFFPGINVSINLLLGWLTIDLLEFHNNILATKKGIFEVQYARLVLGYDDEIFIFPYKVGQILAKPFKFVLKKPKLDSWVRTNRTNMEEFSDETSLNLGEVDPADVTLFQDILFAGEKAYNLTSNEMVEILDSRISYTPRNHFDLRNASSVAEKDPSKKLIGVVDGINIYRKRCERRNPLKLAFFCFNFRCRFVDLPGIDNCFYIDECEIAYGSELIFHSILVLPKDPIPKPVLPLLATTKVLTGTTSTEGSSEMTTMEVTTLAASTDGSEDPKGAAVTSEAPTTTTPGLETKGPEYPKDVIRTVTSESTTQLGEAATSEGSTTLEATSEESSTEILAGTDEDPKGAAVTSEAPTTTTPGLETKGPEYPKDVIRTVTSESTTQLGEAATSEGSTTLEATSEESSTEILTGTDESEASTKPDSKDTMLVSSSTGASQSTSASLKMQEATVTQGTTLEDPEKATSTSDAGGKMSTTRSRTPEPSDLYDLTDSQASRNPTISKRTKLPVSDRSNAFSNKATTSKTSTTAKIQDRTDSEVSMDPEDPRSKEAPQNEALTEEPHNDHQIVFLMILIFGLFFFVLFTILFVLTWRGVLCGHPKRTELTEFEKLE
ncbi:hypothetical protein L596_017428 [Steinernema carpocapsae]|uniref:Uncharacterized protein n=1 Tax=Steinernema carpocapsae TaxID=34508 RepID=A0A4U5N206_STECR|nr:hypothetical protein L596_017428 [Steinernema carpocapsae]